ncbi:hypothetical protein BD310DRAFT_938144 [Dichomitus squalens]|uniref:Uncharacterized protein n=1 Tax=Dichomitus squalens TaxID=114155 RepID=A0A4V2K6S9_9APHY|nr:hypothetical protein BD310DRAFT_938144 [Dichomitus squalens]
MLNLTPLRVLAGFPDSTPLGRHPSPPWQVPRSVPEGHLFHPLAYGWPRRCQWAVGKNSSWPLQASSLEQ